MRAILFAPTLVAGFLGSASLAGAAVLSASDVMKMYTSLGYQILSLKLDDNVYEIKANQNGVIVELTVDSTTGALVADDGQDGVDSVDAADDELAGVDSQDDSSADSGNDDAGDAADSGGADDSGGDDDSSGD